MKFCMNDASKSSSFFARHQNVGKSRAQIAKPEKKGGMPFWTGFFVSFKKYRKNSGVFLVMFPPRFFRVFYKFSKIYGS